MLKQLNPIATLLMGIDVLFMVPLLFNISQGVDHIIVFLMGMINIIALMSVLIIIAGLLPESEKKLISGHDNAVISSCWQSFALSQGHYLFGCIG